MSLKKIMIVDDYSMNVKSLEHMLKNNYEIHKFYDGIDILKNTIDINPDLILLDLMMPDKDGYECLDELQKHQLTKDIPIIIITSLVEYDEIKKSMVKGAFDYIKKPVDKTELFNKVGIALKYKEKDNILKKYQIFANINESILYAKRIQDSILPDKKIIKSIFNNIKILYQPKDILSGDFYWVNEIDNKKYLLLGDCTGHGIPGSILTIIFTLLLDKYQYYSELSPSKVLEYLSSEINIVLNSNDAYTNFDGADAALLMFTDNETLYYSGANIDLIIVSKEYISFNGKLYDATFSNEIYKLYNINANNFSVGRESVDYIFNTYKLKLNKGDRIYLWSDGIYHQFGVNEDCKVKKYSKKRFLQFLLDIQNSNITEIKTLVAEEINKWMCGLDQIDDITFLCLEI